MLLLGGGGGGGSGRIGSGGGDGESEGQQRSAPQLLAAAQLPGELFSSPVLAPAGGGGGTLCVFGCRDDHLYCLRF